MAALETAGQNAATAAKDISHLNEKVKELEEDYAQAKAALQDHTAKLEKLQSSSATQAEITALQEAQEALQEASKAASKALAAVRESAEAAGSKLGGELGELRDSVASSAREIASVRAEADAIRAVAQRAEGNASTGATASEQELASLRAGLASTGEGLLEVKKAVRSGLDDVTSEIEQIKAGSLAAEKLRVQLEASLAELRNGLANTRQELEGTVLTLQSR